MLQTSYFAILFFAFSLSLSAPRVSAAPEDLKDRRAARYLTYDEFPAEAYLRGRRGQPKGRQPAQHRTNDPYHDQRDQLTKLRRSIDILRRRNALTDSKTRRRDKNELFILPIKENGDVDFGHWPYRGKGKYGLGYNYEPIAKIVIPALFMAAIALSVPGVINAVSLTPGRRRRKRDVAQEEDVDNGIYRSQRALQPTYN